MRQQARPVLVLLLLTQLAMVAHRIEHFVAPDLVEAIADCAAFTPMPEPVSEPPVIILPPAQHATRTVWSPVASLAAGEIDQHAYRSQAPPA